MISYLFRKMTDNSHFKAAIWRPVYNFLATKLPHNQWQFMNYGYAPSLNSADSELPLPPNYELQRSPLQMYYYLAEKGPITGKKVLEVGSGRGGGAYFLFNHFHPASYTGLDLADKAVDLCRKTYHTPGLQFVQGEAENLPFSNEEYDIVINIESSRHYGSFAKFLSEVHRVLKPGGRLLLADMRFDHETGSFRNDLASSAMEMKSFEDITENVILSLDRSHDAYIAEIEQNVPRYFRRYFIEFSAVKGTENYAAFKARKRQYFRAILEKK